MSILKASPVATVTHNKQANNTLGLIAFLILCMPNFVLAEAQDLENLQQENVQLKQRLDTLEQKVLILQEYPYVYKEKSDNSGTINTAMMPLSGKYEAGASHNYNSNYNTNNSYNQSKNQELNTVMPVAYGYNLVNSDVYIAGYGTVGYVNRSNFPSYYSLAYFDPILIYKYKDSFMWESQLDFTINSDSSTKTTLKYAFLDWFVHKYITLVGGKFLAPTGKFSNTLYIPWINKLPSNPPGFDVDQATFNEEIGLQARGSIPVCKDMSFNYALFVGNGPQATVTATRFNFISTNGYPRDVDSAKIWGGRLGFFPVKPFEIGISAAIGQVGLFLNNVLVQPSRNYNLFGADLNYSYKNIDLRAEYIQQHIASNSKGNYPASPTWEAFYVQAAYKFVEPHWEAVVRYGDYTTRNTVYSNQNQIAIGLNYWFTYSIVAKVAYEFNNGQYGTVTDGDRFLAYFVYGF